MDIGPGMGGLGVQRACGLHKSRAKAHPTSLEAKEEERLSFRTGKIPCRKALTTDSLFSEQTDKITFVAYTCFPEAFSSARGEEERILHLQLLLSEWVQYDICKYIFRHQAHFHLFRSVIDCMVWEWIPQKFLYSVVLPWYTHTAQNESASAVRSPCCF